MRPHPLLFPLSWLYGLAVRTRNLFYDMQWLPSADVGVPVISIGNITAGGTGKTPVVAATVRMLRDAGLTPAVISRGYGRTSTGLVTVCDGTAILANVEEAGDEPLLLAQLTGNAIVVCDEQRVRGAEAAVKEFGADVIVLDDGFQHRAIRRTVDVVLADVQQPPYSTMLIPAGYRREPMSSLRRASAVLATKAKDPSAAAAMFLDPAMESAGVQFSAGFRPDGIRNIFGGIRQSLEILKGHSAVAVCGIAVPESFRTTLISCGVIVREMIAFPDHHPFTREDVARIIAAFHASSADFILTTEKDAVRLMRFEEHLSPLPVSAVIMDVTFHQPDAWKAFIMKSVGR